MSEMLSQKHYAAEETPLVATPHAVDRVHQLLVQCVACLVFTGLVLFVAYFFSK